MTSIRVTELANDITVGMDCAEIDRFMRMIRAVDSQLFDGWKGYESLCDSSCLRSLRDAAASCAKVLSSDGNDGGGAGGRIVMLGCGTSGRMCHLIELAHQSPRIVSRISGGIGSLAMYCHILLFYILFKFTFFSFIYARLCVFIVQTNYQRMIQTLANRIFLMLLAMQRELFASALLAV